jgi:uncharacterized lipoprotein YddW (UPF0748 family)
MRLVRLLLLPLAATFSILSGASAQSRPEYRAYWIETFNTPMGTRAEIDRVVDAAVQSNANVLVAQVRRRGDSWYLDSKEPLTQAAGVGEPDANGRWTIDPLRVLIEKAHARNIEVHAYVIVGSIYNAHPTVTGLPRDERHVFNRHFWDTSRGRIYPREDSRQWSTRSLPHNTEGVTFDGHRYGAEWYIDPGHPDAVDYTVEVLTHLVRSYDVDGLHLDRIRYPEAPIDRPAGQPLGINTGYNETSVQRFKARHGSAATYYTAADIGTNVGTESAPRRITQDDVGYPRTNDPLWNAWRVEQVTNLVRRIYLAATAAKPRIRVSAALITFWTGPVASGGFERTEAYYRVFQDWKGWTEEGILDVIMPMVYKPEHQPSIAAQYDDWITFATALAHANQRHSVIGLGAFVNSIEGTLRQARRALARPPYESRTAADGVVFYALGSTAPNSTSDNSTNVAVPSNPYSYPTAGLNTPKRTNEDFFSALRTGASTSGLLFEPTSLPPLFPAPVSVPNMPWKSTPTAGYVSGVLTNAAGVAVDGAIVRLTSDSGEMRTARTDGSGHFGLLNLRPGSWTLSAEVAGAQTSAVVPIRAGAVTNVTIGASSVPRRSRRRGA